MEKTTSHTIKKIGFYDSGLGGLFVMSHVVRTFPNYDYVFLADEKNLPYGTKIIEELYGYAKKCIDFLLNKEQCDIIVIACNTISATVYQKLAGEYQITHPNVLIIDIITPTIDALSEDSYFSVFGTPRTIDSQNYQKGVKERFANSIVQGYRTPDLASLIEEKADTTAYIESFKPGVIDTPHTCILACTHYGLVEEVFKKIYPNCTFITQHTIMLDLLKFILHPDPAIKGSVKIFTTRTNPVFTAYAKEWFPDIPVKLIDTDHA